MKIKELYELAKKHGQEDYEIVVHDSYGDWSTCQADFPEFDEDEKKVWL